MAWSEKAIEAAYAAFALSSTGDKDSIRKALDAAAAVDGDAQWNAAIDAAASKCSQRYVRSPIDGRLREQFPEEIAAAIRSLKRLK
jgi:hypothetical protein